MRAYINIYKNTLIDNYNLIKKVIDNKKLFIVLKANAYGYGILEIAKLFSNLNSPSFVVATIETKFSYTLFRKVKRTSL